MFLPALPGKELSATTLEGLPGQRQLNPDRIPGRHQQTTHQFQIMLRRGDAGMAQHLLDVCRTPASPFKVNAAAVRRKP